MESDYCYTSVSMAAHRDEIESRNTSCSANSALDPLCGWEPKNVELELTDWIIPACFRGTSIPLTRMPVVAGDSVNLLLESLWYQYVASITWATYII